MWGRDAEGNRVLVTYAGMNEAGSCGRRAKSGGGRDQIGDEDPVASATTRAYRKACWKVPGMSPKVIDDEVDMVEMRETIKMGRVEGTQHRDLIAQIELLLEREEIPRDIRAYAQSIYDDWVAGAFENVTVTQLLQLVDELQDGLVLHADALNEDEMLDPTTGEVIQDEGLCAHCNASIDMGEPHGETCPMVEPQSVINMGVGEIDLRDDEEEQ